MTHGHTFWFLLVVACVAWYSVITVYVSIRGALDIKSMLRELRQRGAGPGSRDASDGTQPPPASPSPT